MSQQYILALDQGTTSSRAIIFDEHAHIVATAQKEFKQYYPHAGWVEHDPNEIWYSQASVAAEAIAMSGLTGPEIAAIGLTNQRETTIVWERESGRPIYNAIVWQDRRTAAHCDQLKREGLEPLVRERTGLVLDAYFSATKVAWILDNVPGARRKAEKGELLFGTVDCWLAWKFSRGRLHITDVSNASRTMLFNIHTLQWDSELLRLFRIPASMLPEVRPSSQHYGETATTLFAHKIPLAGMAGDQQAALFGQLCTSPGMVKNTYGTGCFMVMNTGTEPVYSQHKLLTTVAWQMNGQTHYALEGSVFIGGAAIQWLRDGLGIISSSKESEQLATSVPDNGGVYFVPALTGLGAPYWDQYARGSIMGLTRGTERAHLVRAALEGVCYQVLDVLQAMEKDMGRPCPELRVDGGASANNFLLQFQSDITGLRLVRPRTMETTALGAAFMAGLAVGFWADVAQIEQYWLKDKVFTPQMAPEVRDRHIARWHKALGRSLQWED